jgi:hypothetical protein
MLTVRDTVLLLCRYVYLCVCLRMCYVGLHVKAEILFCQQLIMSLLHPGSGLNFTQNRLLMALLDHRMTKGFGRSPQIGRQVLMPVVFLQAQLLWHICLLHWWTQCTLMPFHWNYHLPMQRTKADSFYDLESPPYFEMAAGLWQLCIFCRWSSNT